MRTPLKPGDTTQYWQLPRGTYYCAEDADYTSPSWVARKSNQGVDHEYTRQPDGTWKKLTSRVSVSHADTVKVVELRGGNP